MNSIKLKDGEIICPECQGKGIKPRKIDIFNPHDITYKCEKCQGEGKLDWIEQIIGKQPNEKFNESIIFNNDCSIYDGTISKVDEVKLEVENMKLIITNMQEEIIELKKQLEENSSAN